MRLHDPSRAAEVITAAIFTASEWDFERGFEWDFMGALLSVLFCGDNNVAAGHSLGILKVILIALKGLKGLRG